MIRKKEENGVSPVIGVMLMIVVTVIIAAAVSAFAGGMADKDRKAPNAVISCDLVPGNPGGLLFTVESGEYFELFDCYLILSNGEETKRINVAELDKPKVAGVDEETQGWTGKFDFEMNTGNQFYVEADNDGGSDDNICLGWDSTSSEPAFYLTRDEIGTFRIIDRMSGQTISEGAINI